ncbi:uracil-DNA glycosylase [Candidatus Pelagibacter sp.]|nr:uracil-DNA glycosylase [Candidatus Pelagibacter sp.]
MINSFYKLNKKIINCNKCQRLVNFRNKISTEKRKQYINETYWGKPITGFGDLKAKIVIIGLAPAAHGGTRTGRVFTGDKSSDFLYKCLYSAKISNQPNSDYRNDGLKLKDTYITTAIKCVPPEDKPKKNELNNCYSFFSNEIALLKNCKIIIALGKIAFDTCVNFYKINYKIKKKIKFKHGSNYKLPDGKILFGCYHPSPRNVNTKIISQKKMTNLFLRTKNLI